MDQSSSNNPQHNALASLPRGRKVAFIQAGWHRQIVSQAYRSFVEECEVAGLAGSDIELFEVPGSLEIPLQAKLLAKTGIYPVIVAAGFIVDGGIYRHDFVAATVLDAMMQIQLQTEVPILSIVLTPHQFQETEAQQTFFHEHFKIKGREAARACLQTLSNLEKLIHAA
ncbi:MAG TPA: 6,7-dimethyl-8-ribityllumazine synthase [Gammaproteobacteria bacterium]|nr:6,7-dimethyl-8-ribityllumazine synthase [Gammaproteobacteria bacterium]